MGPETASVTPSSIEISSRYFLTLLRYQAFQDVPQQAFVRYPIDQQTDITVTGFCDITMRHSFQTWPITSASIYCSSQPTLRTPRTQLRKADISEKTISLMYI